MSELLVVELGSELRAAIVAPGEPLPRVVVSCRRARGVDLEEELSALREAFARPLPRGALLLCAEVPALCLSLPPDARPSDAELRGLVRWELEPLLAGGEEGEPALAWTPGGGGAVLACALERDELRRRARAFRAAGLRLRAVYPAQACAAPLLPGGHGLAIEPRPEGLALSWLEAGRLRRHGLEAPASFRDLDAAGPALWLGPGSASALEEAGLERLAHEDPAVSAGMLGAFRHACGDPRGACLVALRPQRARGARRLLLLAAALLAGGLLHLLGARALERELREGRARVAEVQARLDRLPAGAALLGEQQSLLAAQLARRERRAEEALAERRRRMLPELLAALAAAAPPQLRLRRLEERPGVLLLHGVARREADAHRFRRALAPALGGLGLSLDPPRLERAPASGGFEFELGARRPAGEALAQ